MPMIFRGFSATRNILQDLDSFPEDSDSQRKVHKIVKKQMAIPDYKQTRKNKRSILNLLQGDDRSGSGLGKGSSKTEILEKEIENGFGHELTSDHGNTPYSNNDPGPGTDPGSNSLGGIPFLRNGPLSSEAFGSIFYNRNGLLWSKNHENVPSFMRSGPVSNVAPGNIGGSIGGSIEGNMAPGGITGSLGNNMAASSMVGSVAGSLPGNLPGSLPGSLAGSLPGSLANSLPGNLPGSLAGNVGVSLPVNLGGTLPGNLPFIRNSPIPNTGPGNLAGTLPYLRNSPGAGSGNIPTNIPFISTVPAPTSEPSGALESVPFLKNGPLWNKSPSRLPFTRNGPQSGSLPESGIDTLWDNSPDSVQYNYIKRLLSIDPTNIQDNAFNRWLGIVPGKIEPNRGVDDILDNVPGNIPNRNPARLRYSNFHRMYGKFPSRMAPHRHGHSLSNGTGHGTHGNANLVYDPENAADNSISHLDNSAQTVEGTDVGNLLGSTPNGVLDGPIDHVEGNDLENRVNTPLGAMTNEPPPSGIMQETNKSPGSVADIGFGRMFGNGVYKVLDKNVQRLANSCPHKVIDKGFSHVMNTGTGRTSGRGEGHPFGNGIGHAADANFDPLMDSRIPKVADNAYDQTMANGPEIADIGFGHVLSNGVHKPMNKKFDRMMTNNPHRTLHNDFNPVLRKGLNRIPNGGDGDAPGSGPDVIGKNDVVLVFFNGPGPALSKETNRIAKKSSKSKKESIRDAGIAINSDVPGNKVGSVLNSWLGISPGKTLGLDLPNSKIGELPDNKVNSVLNSWIGVLKDKDTTPMPDKNIATFPAVNAVSESSVNITSESKLNNNPEKVSKINNAPAKLKTELKSRIINNINKMQEVQVNKLTDVLSSRINSPSDKVINTLKNKINNDSDNKIDNALESKINNAPDSKIVNAPYNKVVNAPESKIYNVPDSKIENAPDSKVVNAPDSKAVNAPDSKIVNAPYNKVVNAPDNKVVNAPDSKIVNAPDSKVVNAPDSKIVNAPDSKVVNAPDSKIVNAPESKIDNVPDSKIYNVPDNNLDNALPKWTGNAVDIDVINALNFGANYKKENNDMKKWKIDESQMEFCTPDFSDNQKSIKPENDVAYNIIKKLKDFAISAQKFIPEKDFLFGRKPNSEVKEIEPEPEKSNCLRIPDENDIHCYYECEQSPYGCMKLRHVRCPKGEFYSLKHMKCLKTCYWKICRRKKSLDSSFAQKKTDMPEPTSDDVEPSNEWLDATQSNAQRIPSEFIPKKKPRLKIYHLKIKRRLNDMLSPKKSIDKRNILNNLGSPHSKIQRKLALAPKGAASKQVSAHRHYPRSFLIRIKKKEGKHNREGLTENDDNDNDGDNEEGDEEEDEDEDPEEDDEEPDDDENAEEDFGKTTEKMSRTESIKEFFRSAKAAVTNRAKFTDPTIPTATGANKENADPKTENSSYKSKKSNGASQKPKRVLLDASIKLDSSFGSALKNMLKSKQKQVRRNEVMTDNEGLISDRGSQDQLDPELLRAYQHLIRNNPRVKRYFLANSPAREN